jgi:hypothetical protein
MKEKEGNEGRERNKRERKGNKKETNEYRLTTWNLQGCDTL